MPLAFGAHRATQSGQWEAICKTLPLKPHCSLSEGTPCSRQITQTIPRMHAFYQHTLPFVFDRPKVIEHSGDRIRHGSPLSSGRAQSCSSMTTPSRTGNMGGMSSRTKTIGWWRQHRCKYTNRVTVKCMCSRGNTNVTRLTKHTNTCTIP